MLFSKTAVSDATDLELIHVVNQQRVLSQRITKAYLYVGNKIAIDEANRQLRDALIEFKATYKMINGLTNSPQIKKIMNFIAKSSGDFKSISKILN